MMENNFSKILVSERNGHQVSQTPMSQPFSLFEKEDDDWNLHQFLSIVRRRALVIVGVATIVMGSVTYVTLKQKPVYEGNFRLLVEPVNDEKDSRLEKLTQETGLSKPSLDYESQIQVLKSPELMAGIIKELQLSDPNINYEFLLKTLTISRVGQTKVIEINYKSDNPQKIKLVLDQIARYYLNYSLDKRQTKLRQGIQFVDQQLPSVKNQVQRLQQEVQTLRQKYNFVTPETQAQIATERIKFLSEQRVVVNQQLAKSRASFASLQGNQVKIAVLNNSPLYQQLILQLRQLETQIATESARFQEDSPPMQTLRAKRENLLPLVQKEAQRVLGGKFGESTAEVQILEVQSQELAKAEQTFDLQVKQLPTVARRYSELQRDLQIATDSLTRFLMTRQTLQIENAQTELPWELIQAAVQPKKPISPNIPRNFLLGMVASTLLGLGAGLLIEKTDNTYHTLESIKEKIKLPLLGVLPFDNKVQNTQISVVAEIKPKRRSHLMPQLPNIFRTQSTSDRYYTQGRFWEALQILYTNIQLLSSDQPIRSLVISSALPGDGKSTVALNLAQIAAVMGKRVLLVDGDLRRPQIHNRTNLSNQQGLTNLISTDIPVDQVIQQLPAMTNLSVITSGPIPPDPARLLSSGKMKRLMAEFQKNFDLVIYDVPPIVGLVDVRLIAPHTDGIVMIVRIDKTDKLGVIQAQDSLKISSTNVLGIAINGDKTKFSAYDYY